MTTAMTWRVGLAVAAANVGALAVLVAASDQAARQEALPDQLSWLSLAVSAAIVALVADGAVLLYHRRRVAHAHARFTRLVGTVAVGGPGPWFALPNGSRFHHAGCLLVAGRELIRADRSEHETAGREPCQACQP